MDNAIEGLEPKAVWKYFSQISQIPRESGNEEGVRQYLLAFAKERNLWSLADKAGNVIIRKAASKGMEDRPWVALQGHMDMVCVKREGSSHDFTRDPIELVRDGSYIHAKDTSLGGDNGIALAMILDILDDESCSHGPLEAIFTVSEETGLSGVYGLEAKNIKSRMLLNLDSEEEGIIYIGCAGGADVEATLEGDYADVPAGWETCTLLVSGLLGGHSGAEIHKQRANAIKLAARLLMRVESKMLVSFSGGTKRNVIPSSCRLSFAYPKEDHQTLLSLLQEERKAFANEYSVSDPSISVDMTFSEAPDRALSVEQSSALTESLYLAPHGVAAMSMTIPGIVETSANLASIRLENGRFSIESSHRSSIMSARDDIARHTVTAFHRCGAEAKITGAYPSWQPNRDSPLAAFCAKAYEEHEKKKPKVTAIHAGLECGIINSKVPGMDSVSFGPDMSGVHSVDERLSIPSVRRTSAFTRKILSIIA